MTASPHTIALQSVLDITGAPALLQVCTEVQDDKRDILIDASDVERITTPAFQVLISLYKTRKAAGLATSISAASNVFNDAMAALGLSQFFKEGEPHE